MQRNIGTSETKQNPGDGKEILASTITLAPNTSPPPPYFDPSLEDYNPSEHVKYLEQKLAEQQKAGTQQILKVLQKLESAERWRSFEENHPDLMRATAKVSVVGDYWTEMSLIYNVLLGGNLLDRAQKAGLNDVDHTFFVLLHLYITTQLLRATFNSALQSEVEYKAAKKQLREILDQKKIISKNTFDVISGSFAADLEKILNLGTIGLIIIGAVKMPKEGGFDAGLTYLGAATLTQAFAGLLNNKVKLSIAEEMIGKAIDRGKVRFSDASMRLLWIGLPGMIAGGGLSFWTQSKISQHPTDHALYSYVGYASFFVFAASVLSVSSLFLRVRGSDYINDVIDTLNLGSGKERLKSFFLNRFPSRSDVDDYLSVGFMTALMGIVASAIDASPEVGYFAVSGASLLGYFSAKATSHLLSRSAVQQLQFWQNSPGRIETDIEQSTASKDKAKPVVEAKDEEETGLRNNACARFFRWLTHAGFCNKSSEPASENKLRR